MTAAPLLEAVALRRRYRARGLAGRGAAITAVDGVDLAVAKGDAVAVVGGSGAGKSTLVRILLALERPDEGVVRFDGHEISAMSAAELRPLRRRFQPVFQDPLASLDPRMRIGAAVAEPLVAMSIGDSAARRRRVAELLDLVGLPERVRRSWPTALSGGERQRVAIARALAPEPELLVLDEPVSSLDAAVSLQVIDLLHELRLTLDLSLVLVTHNVDVAVELCERVVVMDAGRIVEEGETERVFDKPSHQVTKRLLGAAPHLEL